MIEGKVNKKVDFVIPKVNPKNIPDLLKQTPNWIVWKAFDFSSDGRFSKIPIDPTIGKKINCHNRENHLSFDTAFKKYESSSANGIGFVLTGDPITQNREMYLIGVDLDKVFNSEEKCNKAKRICKSLDSYYEISPSRNGIRIFALCEVPLGRGQSSYGEMYYKGRFLTVTGHGKIKPITDATKVLKILEKEWWPVSSKKIKNKLPSYGKGCYPDTPRKRAELNSMLNYLSSDCSYEVYRNIVWAILSTGWADSKDLAYQWCISSPHRFDDKDFHNIINCFNENHENLITIGTIKYLVLKDGWND